jgi:gluconokinase
MRPEWFCATVGTSGALRAVLPRASLDIPWGAWAYRLDRRRFVVGGALSEGGNVIRWFSDGLGIKHLPQAEKAAAKLLPDSHGLTILPFWAGERSPNWRGDARASIAGISLGTQTPHLLRAVMEAISYQFAAVGDALLRIMPRPRAVVATGGRLVHSPAWVQILADVLSLPVIESRETEASSRGAALLALFAIGRRPGLWREKPAAGSLFKPRRAAHAVYLKARARQARLYELLLPPAGEPEPALPTAAQVPASRKPGPRIPASRR